MHRLSLIVRRPSSRRRKVAITPSRDCRSTAREESRPNRRQHTGRHLVRSLKRLQPDCVRAADEDVVVEERRLHDPGGPSILGILFPSSAVVARREKDGPAHDLYRRRDCNTGRTRRRHLPRKAAVVSRRATAAAAAFFPRAGARERTNTFRPLGGGIPAAACPPKNAGAQAAAPVPDSRIATGN